MSEQERKYTNGNAVVEITQNEDGGFYLSLLVDRPFEVTGLSFGDLESLYKRKERFMREQGGTWHEEVI